MGDPRIAAACVVVDGDGRVLLIRRMPDAPIGGGQWAIPGGKLDPGETLENCVRREVLEETGLVLRTVERLPLVTEDLFWGPSSHFVTHYFLATAWCGVPLVGEPHKHDAIGWFEPGRIVAAAHRPDAGMPLLESMAEFARNGGLEAAALLPARVAYAAAG